MPLRVTREAISLQKRPSLIVIEVLVEILGYIKAMQRLQKSGSAGVASCRTYGRCIPIV